MSENDSSAVFSEQIVTAVFSVVCLLSFDSTSRLSAHAVGEIFSIPGSEPGVSTVISDAIAMRHFECAQRVLTLESQAFLTDEQLLELQFAHDELQQNWQQVLRQLKGHISTPPTPSLLRRVDAIFLSQIEWIKDVKYLECDLQTQIKIISESPIAELLGG